MEKFFRKISGVKQNFRKISELKKLFRKNFKIIFQPEKYSKNLREKFLALRKINGKF